MKGQHTELFKTIHHLNILEGCINIVSVVRNIKEIITTHMHMARLILWRSAAARKLTNDNLKQISA